jgi:hypothetical protein
MSEEKKLRDAFKMMDRDNGGTISKGELKKFFKSVGIKFKPQELDKAFDEVDTDGTGEIDFEEFCRLTKKSGLMGGSELEKPEEKSTKALRSKKKPAKKDNDDEIDSEALNIAEEITKLRKKPTSVVEQMDDKSKVNPDHLELNKDICEFCKECLEALSKEKDPVHAEGTGKRFGNLLIDNAETLEGPVKTFIYYGDYESAQELIQKIIKKEDEVDEHIAEHFVNPEYKALGVAYLKPEEEEKLAMTMIAFVTTYVPKGEEEEEGKK